MLGKQGKPQVPGKGVWIVLVLSLAANLYLFFSSGKAPSDSSGSDMSGSLAKQQQATQLAHELSLEVAELKKVVMSVKKQGTGPSKTAPTMEQLGKATGTDKIYRHGYDRFYNFFLEPLRNTKGLNMLEIGFNLGHSYKMWLDYFPYGEVYFMEKDPGSKFAKHRYTGDQGAESDLGDMLTSKNLSGKLDFIIDDVRITT